MSASIDEIAHSMDLEDWAKTITDVSHQSQKLIQSFVEQTTCNGLDPFNLGQAFFEVWTKMAANPMALASSEISLWHDYLNLWNNTARRLWGLDAEPVVEPAPDDKRFKDEVLKVCKGLMTIARQPHHRHHGFAETVPHLCAQRGDPGSGFGVCPRVGLNRGRRKLGG